MSLRPGALALLAAALLAACAGSPAGRRPAEPEAAGQPPAAGAPAAEAGTSGGGAQAPDVAGPAEAVTSLAAGTETQAAPPEGGTTVAAGGTRIVLPTAAERRIQKALAAAKELVPTGEADAVLNAGRELVDSGAITLPEGSALAAQALARFRSLAPGRLVELIPDIEKAHALIPGTADSYAALGEAYLASGNLTRAESAAAAGLTLEGLRTDLLLLRAKVLVATDRWFQARTPLETLLKADPEDADALLLQATILWRYQNDSPGAIEVIQNAFAAHPADLRFPELQGYILYDQGRLTEARFVLNSVLARDPTRLDVVRFLLDDAVRFATWAEARTMLERLAPPATESELFVAYTVLHGSGDLERAAELAARLDALMPDRRYAPLHVRSLLDSGERDQALAVLAEALAATKDGKVRSDLYFLRAAASGEPFTDEAARDLRQALAANPTNVDAMAGMARYNYATGQIGKAQQYALQALRDRPQDPDLVELLKKIEAALSGPGAQ